MERMDHRAAALDEIDLSLLESVERDFDVNLEQLSDELGLSKSAIHYRLNKLRDKDVITGVTADLDPLVFGLNMMMITEVSVSHESGYAQDIGKKVADTPGIQQVYYTMGDVDFVAISRVQTREQMNDLLDTLVAIEGVNETSSRFVMKELAPSQKVLPSLSEEMRRNVIEHSD